MEIETKILAEWNFKPQWLDLLKSELTKRLRNKNVQLIVEDSTSADYIMKINGSGVKVIFWVNIHDKTSIETIFKQSYLDAVMEHEINHLKPKVKFEHDVIPAPTPILQKGGIVAYNNVTKFLTDIFQDCLKEIHANSYMSEKRLHKYLEFEIYKLRNAWSKKHRTLRMMWMLFVAYIEVCYKMIGRLAPSELHSIIATLRKHPIDASIYEQIKIAYMAMWNKVKNGQRSVNLLKETYELNELVRNQRNPFM